MILVILILVILVAVWA